MVPSRPVVVVAAWGIWRLERRGRRKVVVQPAPRIRRVVCCIVGLFGGELECYGCGQETMSMEWSSRGKKGRVYDDDDIDGLLEYDCGACRNDRGLGHIVCLTASNNRERGNTILQ